MAILILGNDFEFEPFIVAEEILSLLPPQCMRTLIFLELRSQAEGYEFLGESGKIQDELTDWRDQFREYLRSYIAQIISNWE